MTMNRKNVLVVTNRQAAGTSLQDWTAIAHPFHVNLVETDEHAIECCHLQQFDMVVVDTTDQSIDNKKLKAVIPILQEETIVIEYDGEPAEKLTERIEAIFNARKYKRILNMIMLESNGSDLPQFSLN